MCKELKFTVLLVLGTGTLIALVQQLVLKTATKKYTSVTCFAWTFFMSVIFGNESFGIPVELLLKGFCCIPLALYY